MEKTPEIIKNRQRKFEDLNEFFEAMIEAEKFFGEEEALVEKINNLSLQAKYDIFEIFKNAKEEFRLLDILRTTHFSEEDLAALEDFELFSQERGKDEPPFIQKYFEERAKKVAPLFKQAFLVVVGSTVISYISAYHFTQKYFSKKNIKKEVFHKKDDREIEEMTKEIFFS